MITAKFNEKVGEYKTLLKNKINEAEDPVQQVVGFINKKES